MKRISLLRHPSSPAPTLRIFEVGLERTSEDALSLTFDMRADPAALQWPVPQTPAFRDGLWQHTCLELFAAAVGSAYREFNFSPSGEFAIYDFDAYRSGMRAVQPARPPRIHSAADEAGWTVGVVVPAELLVTAAGAAHRLGVTAVLEGRDGALSYWAVHHPAERPDFHDRGGFVLTWPPAS
ncbi:MAG: DOMON-like domain-containing protein [Cyanobacteria bacterium SZAS LIN-2]|nr:DOMON-like domain-containing protein [Cyanobacteria bacterium SZAS LIN-2]